MSTSEEYARCFECGRASSPEEAFALLESGERCDACHDRFLASQPALLPGFGRVSRELEPEVSFDAGELPFDESYADEEQERADEDGHAELSRTQFKLLEGGSEPGHSGDTPA